MGAVVDHAWGNAVLECLLARAGWAPENLGDRLNELAARLGRRDRIHRKSIRRRVYTEPGRSVPAVPREPWPGLVCHLLRERLGEPVTLDSLGWNAAGPLRIAAADDGLNQSWNPRGAVAVLASVVDADAMERRHFMALTGLPLTPGRAPMAARPGSGGGLSAGQASRSRAGGRPGADRRRAAPDGRRSPAWASSYCLNGSGRDRSQDQGAVRASGLRVVHALA